MPAKKKHSDSPALDDFESLVDSIVQIHHQAQDFATKAVNVGLTLRNWLIGHRIVEFEQNGKDRAAYGERSCCQSWRKGWHRRASSGWTCGNCAAFAFYIPPILRFGRQ